MNLTNNLDVSVELETIARNLKKKQDDASASRVQQLAEAVKNGTNVDIWAAVNIYQAINPETIIEGLRKRRTLNKRVTWFEVIRNVLILAPLVISWLYIWQAVGAYSQLIAGNSDQTGTFLYLWEQGFNGRLPGILTLGWMAFFDCLILSGVLILTFLVFISKEQEVEHLRSQFANALAGADLCLRTRWGKQPGNLVDNLKTISDKFEQQTVALMTRIESMSTALETQLRTFGTFRNDLRTLFTDLKTEISSLTHANSTLATNISTSYGALTTNLGQMNTNLNEATKKMDALGTQALTASQLLREEIADQKKILTEQQRWGATIQQLLEKLEKAVLATEAAAKGQSTVATQMQAALTDIAEQQKNFLLSIEKQQKAQAQLEIDMNAMVISVQRIVDELGRCATDLRGYTNDMDEVVRRAATRI